MNGDTKVYKEIAARYFNLSIAWRTLARATYNVSDFAAFPDTPRLFHIMAATDPEVQKVFINMRYAMDAETLERACKETRKAIGVRCAGLLEVAQDPYPSLHVYIGRISSGTAPNNYNDKVHSPDSLRFHGRH